MKPLTDVQCGQAANAAYAAVAQEETKVEATYLLYAFSDEILYAVANMVHVEVDGRSRGAIIRDILTEI
jgi:hypothetical protein